MPSGRRYAGVLALFAAAIVLRIAWLGRYPAHHSDEGYWAGGARNHVLFGDAFLDHRLHPYLSPATYAGLVGHFSLLSPDLTTARLFSVIAGIGTCLIVWVMARRLLPGRPWLPLLIAAVSGFSVLVHRIMLLEAHQTFWLALAAALFLSEVRGKMALAGAAYGVAMLVKSNSVYLAPAVLVALPGLGAVAGGSGAAKAARRLASKLLPAAVFFGAAAAVGGAGYLLARATDPQRFGWAFQYELASKHFLARVQDPMLFHFGRLGFRPLTAASVTVEMFRGDPFLLVPACVAIGRVLRRPAAALREDRFFAAWAICGYLFDMVQINCTHRYLAPIAPALVFLAARTLDRAFPAGATADWGLAAGRLGAIAGRFGMAAACAGLAGHCIARLSFGVFQQQPNREYWQSVEFIRDRVSRDASVMAASYISLSLPQKSYDFYRVLRPYEDEDHPLPLAAEVEKRHIRVIVRDSEWREYETADTAAFLSARCSRLAEFGPYEILGVLRPEGEITQ